ncbi:hypothetical protein SEA_RADFAD_88 [Arthrobacter phage RadFad]|nr:hypothetical protein SEA_RADFAD_88 [Arthrobacter phage RadFad]
MTTSNPSAAEAAILLLNERAHEHHSKAARAKVATVYVGSTPTPDTADDAVKITERAFLESCVAEALYHQREAARFDNAIEAIRATEQDTK